MANTDIYSIPVRTIDGETTTLAAYRGKLLLIVNVASKCGFTAQYAGLESLYRHWKDRGLVVLGFPCNQFGAQEPADEATIKDFCSKNFGVSFPLFAKIKVNGEDAHPLYQYLKSASPGVLGTEAIKWNFTKFLVSADGTVLERFAPNASPESIEAGLKKLLEPTR